MKEKNKIKGGEIIAIPLFLVNQSDSMLNEIELDGKYAFARVIEEKSGKVLIEVFSKLGEITDDLKPIMDSGLLIKPLYTVWSGVKEKRWKLVGCTDNYDKIINSSYNEIQLVTGSYKDFKLWSAKDNSLQSISVEEVKKHQLMGIYPPIQIEKRIISKLNEL